MAFDGVTSTARQPRVYISVGGAAQSAGAPARLAPTECSVHLSLHQNADTFYLKLPLDNDAGLDETFWADTAPIPITISATNDIAAGDPTTLLIGQTDEPQIDFAGRAVEIKGTDLTTGLVDLKTDKQWRNKSNQDVINELAGNVGLTVQFGTDTDKAGLQFDQDFNEISDLDSCWNVIVDCAKRLGCIAFVKGKTLYVQPVDQPASNVYALTYQRPTQADFARGNFVRLLCARNLRLAKDISIASSAWQHKQGKKVTSKFHSRGRATGSDTLLYQFRGANLTKEQNDRITRNHLRETLAHERVVHVEGLPGDVTAIPPLGLSLDGTGTAFDQSYVVSDVVHRFSMGAAYLMDITANSPDATRGAPTQLE